MSYCQRIAFLLLLLSAVSFAAALDHEALLNDVKILSADDMQGRFPDTPGGKKAQAYVLKRFQANGIVAFHNQFLQPFTFVDNDHTIHGANIIGYISGKSDPNHYLVVSAHYDHLGMKDGVVYNGADDNATGVATILAMGKYLAVHRPEHSILFCAFDAEEEKGGGSPAFFKQLPVEQSSIVMNVNIDMIGRDKNNILYAVGTYHYPFLKKYLDQAAIVAPVKLVYGHDRPDVKDVEDWTTESDHAIFYKNKIPFIYFGVEDYENQHQPSDDYETIQKNFFASAAETVLNAVLVFDQHLDEIRNRQDAKNTE
jgi:Zn-dependent M28 family amino/carboxypeptidase